MYSVSGEILLVYYGKAPSIHPSSLFLWFLSRANVVISLVSFRLIGLSDKVSYVRTNIATST